MNIDVVWENVKRYEGEDFKRKNGEVFKYIICKDCLWVVGIKGARVTKASLESALTIENPSPSKIAREGVWGSTYVYGIITDERIRCF